MRAKVGTTLACLSVVGLMLVAHEYYGQPPSPTVLAWNQTREDRVFPTSESYEYLLGISAAEGKNIRAVGKQRLAVIQAIDAETGPIKYDDAFQHQTDADDIQLPNETGNGLHCVLVDAGCLDRIATDHAARRAESDRLAVVKQRYETFLAFDEFATLPGPTSQYVPPTDTLSLAIA